MDDAAALDAAVDVRDAHAAPRDASIGGLLAAREGSASGRAGRHDDLDLVEHKRQEAEVLEPPAPRGQGLRRGLCTPLVVGPTRGGLTQEEDREHSVEQPHVFHRVALVLAAIRARLRSRILRTPDTPFGASCPQGGRREPVPVPLGADWTRSVAPAPTPPARLRPPRSPRDASPALSRTAWEHPRAHAASPAGRPTGHASTDGLCLAHAGQSPLHDWERRDPASGTAPGGLCATA
jgi:hypothetical protein